MKKLFIISILLIGFNINAQEVVTDWRKLDEHSTLKEYIENQAYQHLTFKLKEKKVPNNIEITHRSANTKIIIREKASIPDTPIVIINKLYTDNIQIWNSIKLNHVKNITLYRPTKETLALYVARAKHGLIFVEVSKRKWRKLKREFGN
ncbi:hypothetical protein [Roseivirga pacifica]|uniref:hypothetical protein n=1 Tax=Roseivirga pacifica TaxID=1267423 RepID=UPI003BAE3BDB